MDPILSKNKEAYYYLVKTLAIYLSRLARKNTKSYFAIGSAGLHQKRQSLSTSDTKLVLPGS